jgi:alpha-glucosidase (family GH31 glycosyl hydrolase)
MLGPSLLVAPVFVPEGEESEYYLPEGRWTSFFHPERVVQGPKWVKEVVPLDDIPLWVRSGSVLVLGPDGIGRPDYPLAEGVEIRAYELNDGQTVSVEVPTGQGLKIAGTINVLNQGGKLSIDSTSVKVSDATLFINGQQYKQ